VKTLVALSLVIACLALALHISPGPDVDTTTSPTDAAPKSLSVEILTKGLGYHWHPIDLQGLGDATMIGVSRSTDGNFAEPGGSCASLPEDRNEPLYVFFKVEDNWLHYSVVSSKSRLSSKLPLLLPTDSGPRGASNSPISGTPIQIGEAFLSIDTTDGDGESSASMPPDYAAGNAGFAVFVK